MFKCYNLIKSIELLEFHQDLKKVIEDVTQQLKIYWVKAQILSTIKFLKWYIKNSTILIFEWCMIKIIGSKVIYKEFIIQYCHSQIYYCCSEALWSKQLVVERV